MRISSVLVVCSSLRFRFSSRCCSTFLVVSMIKPPPPPNWSLKITTSNKSLNRERRERLANYFFFIWSLHFEECAFILLFSFWSQILRNFSKGAQFSFGSHIFEIEMFIWYVFIWFSHFWGRNVHIGMFSFGPTLHFEECSACVCSFSFHPTYFCFEECSLKLSFQFW